MRQGGGEGRPTHNTHKTAHNEEKESIGRLSTDVDCIPGITDGVKERVPATHES